MSAKAPSGPVILAASGGTVVCHTAICTHMGCEVAASGACPCHGSKFNVETGAVEQGPATAPLAAVPVTVSGGQVYASRLTAQFARSGLLRSRHDRAGPAMAAQQPHSFNLDGTHR